MNRSHHPRATTSPVYFK